MLPMPAPCCHLLTCILLPATLQPPHVVLVHGEANEMGRLKKVCCGPAAKVLSYFNKAAGASLIQCAATEAMLSL